MEPLLRSIQVRKQEAEELGYQGKEVADYVKQEQALDREERAAWRGTQQTIQADLELAKIRAEVEEKEKKRADEILMAEIQAEAEEKKRADKIQMAKVEDKEPAIKELVLKPRNKPILMLQLIHLPATEMLSSRPKLPAFINEKDELDLQLPAFS